MKKKLLSIVALIVLAAMILTGCGPKEPGQGGHQNGDVDCNALLQSLLTNVKFDTELKSVGGNASLFFPELPEGSQVILYTGSGEFADRLALVTLAKASDRKAALPIVEKHVAEVRDQVMKYAPQEVGKLDSAIIYENGNHILLCVTADAARAQDIIDHAGDPSYVPSGSQGGSAEAGAADCSALLQALRSKVKFDTELRDAGSNAALFFPDLPAGSQVVFYNGSGEFADRLALLTLPDASGMKAARAVVDKHIAEVRDQIMKYAPDEVGKLDNAIIYESGNQILLCVTGDTAGAQEIIDHADDPAYVPPVPQASEAVTEQAPSTENQQLTEATESSGGPEATEEEPDDGSYPVLKSEEGTYHDYGNGFIRVDNRAFEGYGFISSSAQNYAGLVNKVADSLAGTKTKVYSLPIPTAPGIVLPDDIIAQMGSSYTNQGEAIDKVFAMMDENVIPVNCYSNLMRHRDEYLYFRTDYHWNGRGAYYAYETFCKAKGVKPYTLDQRELKEFGNYLGVLYESCSNHDSILSATPDTVEAFCPVAKDASMTFTDKDGNTVAWSIITDVSDWNSGSKYNTFAGSDQPFAVFTNPSVTDGSVCVIVKDSYGNALLPYLVDHYSTIYEIDYRYWNGNLSQFVQEKNADDLIIAHNMVMISSDYLIGMFANIVG